MKKTTKLSSLVLLFMGTTIGAGVSADTAETLGSVSFSAGDLKMGYVSPLAFGTKTISASAETFYAAPDEDKALYVEFQDLRGVTATEANATLTVEQKAQFTNGTNSLDAAEISFTNAKSENAGGGDYKPEIEMSDSLKLTPGEASNVASVDGTVGDFKVNFGEFSDYDANIDGPVSLMVPSGVMKTGAYTSTLEWTITAD